VTEAGEFLQKYQELKNMKQSIPHFEKTTFEGQKLDSDRALQIASPRFLEAIQSKFLKI